MTGADGVPEGSAEDHALWWSFGDPGKWLAVEEYRTTGGALGAPEMSGLPSVAAVVVRLEGFELDGAAASATTVVLPIDIVGDLGRAPIRTGEQVQRGEHPRVVHGYGPGRD